MIQDPKLMRKTDIAFGCVLMVLAGFFMWQSSKMLSGGAGTMTDEIFTAPGILPLVVSSIIFLLGLILVGSALLGGARICGEDLRKALCSFKKPETLRILAMVAIIAGYVFGLIGRVPFMWATFIYLTVFMLAFKASKWYWVLVIAGVTSFLIAYSFGNLVLIPLP